MNSKNIVFLLLFSMGLSGCATGHLSENDTSLERYNRAMFSFNNKIDKYVIMPNHFHLILNVKENTDGASETAAPYNNETSKFISLLKNHLTFLIKSCKRHPKFHHSRVKG